MQKQERSKYYVYDERIENIKGKIVRNSVIISTSIALVVGALRFIYMLVRDYDLDFILNITALDLCIAVGGIVYLTVGFITKRILELNKT